MLSKETRTLLDQIQKLVSQWHTNPRDQEIIKKIRELRSLINDEEYVAYLREEKMPFYKEENRDTARQKEILSPSGNFRLVVDTFITPREDETHGWKYSRGQVFRTMDGSLVGEIYRNYPSFWYCFVTHKDGNEYMFAGEDYQGYSRINLTQGTTRHMIQADYEFGWGWCTVSMHPNPQGDLIVADGCYWACPYNFRVLDFSDPEVWPLPIKSHVHGTDQDFSGWIDNDSFVYTMEYEGFTDPETGKFVFWDCDGTWELVDPKEKGILDWTEITEEEYDHLYETAPERLGIAKASFVWNRNILPSSQE